MYNVDLIKVMRKLSPDNFIVILSAMQCYCCCYVNKWDTNHASQLQSATRGQFFSLVISLLPAYIFNRQAGNRDVTKKNVSKLTNTPIYLLWTVHL